VDKWPVTRPLCLIACLGSELVMFCFTRRDLVEEGGIVVEVWYFSTPTFRRWFGLRLAAKRHSPPHSSASTTIGGHVTWWRRAECSSRFGTFHSGFPPVVRVERGRDKALPTTLLRQHDKDGDV
jgi:hypothetical protein